MPELIELAHTGTRTTRLGFGCSGLMGGTSRGTSLRLLESAYEAGIRHFDVAPMYGYGEAEGCLGEFLAKHSGHVTVTTKFGIPPGKDHRWLRAAKHLARNVLGRLPEGIQRLRKVPVGQQARVVKLAFTAAAAQSSLERSLRNLRTDHVHLWLLHEAIASDLQDDGLLRFMESAVVSGKVGSFGVGSEKQHIPALQAEKPRYCNVLQFQWSIFDPILPDVPPFRVHHRSLTEDFRGCHRWFMSDPARCEAWSRETGSDLRVPSVFAALMLRASLDCNPRNIVLFSSKSPEHICENVRVSEDHSLRQAALALQAVAHRESAAVAYSEVP